MGNDVAKYPSDEQLTLLKSIFRDDQNYPLYEDIMKGFGDFVVGTILPAETYTDECRAGDFAGQLTARLEEIGAYTEQSVKNAIADCENDKKIPQHITRSLIEQGFTGISFPEELGGMGLPHPIYIGCLETLAKASASLTTKNAISNTCAEGLKLYYQAGGLSPYGVETLRKLVRGEWLAAFALTEAAVPGSNIMREMKTRAALSSDGTSVVLNGSKMYITNTDEADIYFVFGKTPGEGVSLVMVEPDMKGFRIGQKIRKMTVQNSVFGEIYFENLEVPLERVVGGIGAGTRHSKRMLNSGRLTIAAVGLGICQRALEEYVRRAEDRILGDKPLIDYPINQATIDRFAQAILEVRKITYEAAYYKEQCEKHPTDELMDCHFAKRSAQAKRAAAALAHDATQALIHISGAMAVTNEDYLPLKLYHDSLVVEFGEGVKEVLDETIEKMDKKIARLQENA